MARIHARRRGKSGSVRPHRDEPPAWSTTDAAEIEQLVVDLSRKERSSAEIGMILRDQYAVPDVKLATGRRIGEILEANDLGGEIPEDLRNLIVKALGMRKHLAENRNDVHNKRQLQLTESKVRRLVKYYVGSKRLPSGWVYKPETAEILLSR
jgi:small subunit ribosomal protein S15